MQFCTFFPDSPYITLSEEDISDPAVNVDVRNLTKYSKEHLCSWLLFRGESLEGVESLKDARVRYVIYFSFLKSAEHLQ